MTRLSRTLRLLARIGGAMLVGFAIAIALTGTSIAEGDSERKGGSAMPTHRFIGMWVTPDGHIRHKLLPNGRYDEARGNRRSAYQGRYEIRGNHIDYWDDTGFTADGTFVSEDELHHGGMIFHRQR
jgi:hypothetical protein